MGVSDRVMQDVNARYKPDATVFKQNDQMIDSSDKVVDLKYNKECIELQLEAPVDPTEESILGITFGDAYTQRLMRERKDWKELQDINEHARLHRALIGNFTGRAPLNDDNAEYARPDNDSDSD